MSVELAGGCRVSEMREGEPRTSGPLRVWDRIGRASGAKAISLRILELVRGRAPTIANAACEEVFFVLAGRGTARIDGVAFELEKECGFFRPPQRSLELENPYETPLVLTSSRCPEPDSNDEVAPERLGANDRAHVPALVRLSDRPSETTADRWYKTLVDERRGSRNVTQFVGGIPPGRAPDHYHHYEEVLCILRGSGRMWADERSTPIGPGSCIYLPPRQVHCVENTGAGELVLLGVFYPSGSPAVRYDGPRAPHRASDESPTA